MLPEIGSDTDEPVSPCIPSPTLLLPVGRFVPDHPNDPDAPPLSPLPAESVKSEDETEDLPIGRFYGFHPCYYTRCMVSFDGSLKDLNSAFGGILQVFQSSLYRIRLLAFAGVRHGHIAFSINVRGRNGVGDVVPTIVSHTAEPMEINLTIDYFMDEDGTIPLPPRF